MPKPLKPFVAQKRRDTGTWTITINTTSGVPSSICHQWKWKSFQNLPAELVQYQNPANRNAAEAGVFALIQYLTNNAVIDYKNKYELYLKSDPNTMELAYSAMFLAGLRQSEIFALRHANYSFRCQG
jgi:hypothetical protein